MGSGGENAEGEAQRGEFMATWKGESEELTEKKKHLCGCYKIFRE